MFLATGWRPPYASGTCSAGERYRSFPGLRCSTAFRFAVYADPDPIPVHPPHSFPLTAYTVYTIFSNISRKTTDKNALFFSVFSHHNQTSPVQSEADQDCPVHSGHPLPRPACRYMRPGALRSMVRTCSSIAKDAVLSPVGSLGSPIWVGSLRFLLLLVMAATMTVEP